MNKKFEPLITNTVKTKHVTVKGKNDFSSKLGNVSSDIDDKKEIVPIIKKGEEPKILRQVLADDQRKKANRTQKMSDDVILKIDILKPFLKELEDIDNNIKPTINDMIDLLLDNYIHTKLTTKQLEAYQAIYAMRFEQL